MSGSEKKAKLLAIVRAELDRQGMNAKDPNYKKCIKKLHEMCRMMLKVRYFSSFQVFRTNFIGLDDCRQINTSDGKIGKSKRASGYRSGRRRIIFI